ncbi:MAG: NUDIX hydrolase [Microthrixaceae bacterium]|nr:NUDIX hydrolase [Microthrixaceae bacterium]
MAEAQIPDTDWEPTIGPGMPEDFWDLHALPAATAIIARDNPGSAVSGVQTLMLRRDKGLRFAGDMWVFPGGRIEIEHDSSPTPVGTRTSSTSTDAADSSLSLRLQLEEASRHTAVRETAEEAGLQISPERLIRWSHWTAPPGTSRRFTTAFFLTTIGADHDAVTIDDGEIRDFQWLAPTEALEQHAAGELALTPPTFITLVQLVPFERTADLMSDALSRPMEHFASRFSFIGDRVIAMYHGDAGYELSNAEITGGRHRLSMGTRWTYERDTPAS